MPIFWRTRHRGLDHKAYHAARLGGHVKIFSRYNHFTFSLYISEKPNLCHVFPLSKYYYSIPTVNFSDFPILTIDSWYVICYMPCKRPTLQDFLPLVGFFSLPTRGSFNVVHSLQWFTLRKLAFTFPSPVVHAS
jgi:hypothetical protein